MTRIIAGSARGRRLAVPDGRTTRPTSDRAREGVFSADRAERLAAAPCPDRPYDVAFLDPPYALPAAELAAVLVTLSENGWLAGDALVAVERASRGAPWVFPEAFDVLRSRAYG